MIVVRLMGGLGNQLFQFAAGRKLADKHKAELVFETSWFGMSFQNSSVRKYELSSFHVAARLMTPEEVCSSRIYTGTVLKRLPVPRRLRLFRERQFQFDPEVLCLPDQVFLEGYWQSPRYFDAIAETIRTELTPIAPMGDEDMRIADLIGKTNSVAIHVRRGDYAALGAAQATHGTCALEYYHEAVRRAIAKVGSPTFFLFSDDPDWCRANLRIDGPMTYVTHNSTEAAVQDLRLMSLCQHQIVANSSFSWWAAWLNVNPVKFVVAPKRWFRTSEDTSDLIPDNWLRI